MHTRIRRICGPLLALVLVAVACGGESGDADGPATITLMTHNSFAVSEGVIEAFEAETGHTVEILRSDDAGAMVNQAILTKDNPLADVIFGVDNSFLGRALDADLFEPYEASGIEGVRDSLRIDNAVTPITFGDVCLNYDIAGLADAGLPVPASLRELTDPAYAGTLVVQHPATSSPGLAFLMSTVAEFGEDGDYTWQDFWRDLVANDALVMSGWEEAYYGEFSGGSGAGSRPLVVSYASSPPAEVIFADPPVTEAPTAVVATGCFRQIEFAGVLAGTDVPSAARQFIDFMLTPAFQEDIPLNMFVFPTLTAAALPPEFVEHTQVPQHPNVLTPAEIAENRDRWIEEWNEIVLP